MIDWKEFLEKYDAWFDSFNERDEKDVHPSHRKRYVGVEELEKHFLGEVVRIEKEIDKFKAKLRAKSFDGSEGSCSSLIIDSKMFGRLDGQLRVYKELAGVEQNAENKVVIMLEEETKKKKGIGKNG